LNTHDFAKGAPMPEVIVKADRGYRKKLFTAYALCIFFLGMFAWICLPLIMKYLNACEIPKFLNLTEICALAFLLLFVGPAIFLINTGRKILRHNQVPYPGMKVIHDTKVILGKGAVTRGRLLIALGVLSIFVAIAGSIITHYYFEKFRHFNPIQSAVRVADSGRSDNNFACSRYFKI
jgi:hypothetical protein